MIISSVTKDESKYTFNEARSACPLNKAQHKDILSFRQHSLGSPSVAACTVSEKYTCCVFRTRAAETESHSAA